MLTSSPRRLRPWGAHFVYKATSPQNGFRRWALEAPTLFTNPSSPPGGLTPRAPGAPTVFTSSPRRLRPWGAHFVYKPTSPQDGLGRWALEAPTLLRNPPSPPSGFAHWAPAAPVFFVTPATAPRLCSLGPLGAHWLQNCSFPLGPPPPQLTSGTVHRHPPFPPNFLNTWRRQVCRVNGRFEH